MLPTDKKAVHILHQRRRAGVLLHPTSLPGPYPRGLICHDAYRFIEFLAQSGMSVWQMLPLGVTHQDFSPYQALSAHACETSMISIDWLQDRGLLKVDNTDSNFKGHEQCLRSCWELFKSNKKSSLHKQYESFNEQQSYWLQDYSLFMAIRDQQKLKPWFEWSDDLRDRDKNVIKAAKKKLSSEIDYYQFTQFIFFQQWQDLKKYAAKHDVLLFGDLPIYVSHDSADVWLHPELFMLEKDGRARYVAGVPPDYFSETGQRWGNPQYDWAAMQNDQFDWWKHRIKTQIELFDVIRVDHFRGFEAYWEIEAKAETAIDGRWVNAPGRELLQALNEEFHALPLVAEDLGTITDEVIELRDQFNLPGMKVLQFAFDGNPKNIYLPPHHDFHSVIYTGTHDNDTTVSWYEQLPQQDRDYIYNYLNFDLNDRMPWPLIKSALSSVGCLAVFPLQDILSLGKGHRMNTPGTTEDNWQWRFNWDQIDAKLSDKLSSLCQRYDR